MILESATRATALQGRTVAASTRQGGLMAGEHVLEVTDDSFDREIVKSDKPALVDFWAAWCGPCRAIAPIVEDLASSYAGKVKFGKLDVDKNQKVAEQFDI